MDVPDCTGCKLRDERIAVLEAEVAALNKKLDELLRRLPPPPRAHEPMPPAPAKKRPAKSKAGSQAIRLT